MLENIAEPIQSIFPLTMEEIGQNYGYILYRLKIKDTEKVHDIRLEDASDRILCYHDRKYLYTAFAETLYEKFEPEEKKAGGTIHLLCENMGRENFGTGIEDQRKGISGSVKINDRRHFGYDIFPLPLEETQIEKINFSAGYSDSLPAFYKFEFDAEELGDTFLDAAGFGKGCAFINGFHLGRFWEIGPQKRLYIPAPLLKKGKNTLIIFETEGRSGDKIVLTDTPDLG